LSKKLECPKIAQPEDFLGPGHKRRDIPRLAEPPRHRDEPTVPAHEAGLAYGFSGGNKKGRQ